MIHKILPKDVKKQWGVVAVLILVSIVSFGYSLPDRWNLASVTNPFANYATKDFTSRPNYNYRISLDGGKNFSTHDFSGGFSPEVFDEFVSRDGGKIILVGIDRVGELKIHYGDTGLGTNLPPIDTTPPTITSRTPASFNSGAVTLSFETNENADCKYASTNIIHAGMTSVSNTGARNHSQALTLNPGSYTYFVKCADKATTPNVNPDGYPIGFTVTAPAVVEPTSIYKSSTFERVRLNERDQYLTNGVNINTNPPSVEEDVTTDSEAEPEARKESWVASILEALLERLIK